MISVSSSPISTSLIPDDFSRYFNQLENVIALFDHRSVRHLTTKNNSFSFILKRVALFEFTLSKQKGEFWVQYDSCSSTVFKSAFRIELKPTEQEIVIHFETDTNVFMEFFLERRIKILLDGLVNNAGLIPELNP